MTEEEQFVHQNYDRIMELAYKMESLHRISQGVRGQMVMPQDGLDWWIMFATLKLKKEMAS